MQDETSLLTYSTARLLKEFKACDVPCGISDAELNIIWYKTSDGMRKTVRGMVSEDLPLFSKWLCDDKYWTYKLFQELDIPTPATHYYRDLKEANVFLLSAEQIVVKPRYGAHGNGVQLNITNMEQLTNALEKARSFDTDVLLQKQLNGIDIRILVIGGRIVSALERRPARVTGDGKHTVSELIGIENQREDRGVVGIDALIKISVPAAVNHLTKQQLNYILPNDRELRVTGPANQSLGGTVHDAINLITEEIRENTLQITDHLQMPIAGVDCLITNEGHYFLEINASPGIGIHDDNFAGVASGCFKVYAELLNKK